MGATERCRHSSATSCWRVWRSCRCASRKCCARPRPAGAGSTRTFAAVLDLPQRDVVEALRTAIHEGILVDFTGLGGRPAGYAFRHALLREVVYGVLLQGEQIRLHAAFAAQLAERGEVGGVPVEPSELAYLWDAARDAGRAVPALVDAGRASERAYAFADAARQYERALELWDGAGAVVLPEGLDRVGVLERAAECALMSGDYAHAVERGRDAIATLEADPGHDDARLGRLHNRLRWYLWEAGDLAAASAAVDEALRLLPVEPPSQARARALTQSAGLRMMAGDVAEAAALAQAGLATARDSESPGEEALALGILGYCQAVSGDVDGGVATFRQGLSVAEGMDSLEGIALGYTNLAALLDRVGRTEQSLEAAHEGFEIVRRFGVARTYGGILLGHAAKALFDLGRWDEARAAVDLGLELDPVSRPAVWLHINHARLDVNQGRLDDAASHLERARSLAGSVGRGDPYESALMTGLAELALAQGRIDERRRVADIAIAGLRDDRPPDPTIGWLAAHVLRGEADEAALGRARHDPAAVETAVRRAAAIGAWLDRAATMPIAASDARRAAIDGLCRAEIARLRGPARSRSLARRRWLLGEPRPSVSGGLWVLPLCRVRHGLARAARRRRACLGRGGGDVPSAGGRAAHGRDRAACPVRANRDRWRRRGRGCERCPGCGGHLRWSA